MKYVNNNQGITLIELIASICISFSIIAIIHILFFNSLEEFHQIEDEVEVQYQLEIAMDELSKKLSTIEKVTYVQDIDLTEITNKAEEYQISKIIFDDQWIFEHKQESQSLFYGEITPMNKRANVLYANYISSFVVKPLPEQSTYKNCRGLQIKFTSKKDDVEIGIINSFYFP